MTTNTIDTVISNDRRNIDRQQVMKTMQMIKKSEEFYKLVNATSALGLSYLELEPTDNVSAMIQFVENTMALALDIGYRTKEQEIGTAEMERMFPEDYDTRITDYL